MATMAERLQQAHFLAVASSVSAMRRGCRGRTVPVAPFGDHPSLPLRGRLDAVHGLRAGPPGGRGRGRIHGPKAEPPDRVHVPFQATLRCAGPASGNRPSFLTWGIKRPRSPPAMTCWSGWAGPLQHQPAAHQGHGGCGPQSSVPGRDLDRVDMGVQVLTTSSV